MYRLVQHQLLHQTPYVFNGMETDAKNVSSDVS